MHPDNPDILLAGAGNNTCSEYWLGGKHHSTGGAFLPMDAGRTWTQTVSNVDHHLGGVRAIGSQHRLCGRPKRFHRSTDGGKTWTGRCPIPWGPPGALAGFPIDILVDPDDPNTLFVNNYGGGNVRSTDGGRTWSIASQGYTGALMFDVEIHPTTRTPSTPGPKRPVPDQRQRQKLVRPVPSARDVPRELSVRCTQTSRISCSPRRSWAASLPEHRWRRSWQQVFRLPVRGGIGDVWLQADRLRTLCQPRGLCRELPQQQPSKQQPNRFGV